MNTGDGFLGRLGRSFAAGGPPTNGACPAPETLWDAFHGCAATDARATVVDHLARCAACAADWDVLRAVPAAAAAERPRRAPRMRSRAWRPLLSTAAVLLAATLAVLVVRGPAAPPGSRSIEAPVLRSLTTDAPLARGHAQLRWTDLGAGARYTVDVTTEGLEHLVTARGIAVTAYALPAQVLERVPRGAILVWRVEAVLPDGRHVASPAFRARVE